MQKGAFNKTRRADREHKGGEGGSRTGVVVVVGGANRERVEPRLIENDKMTSHEGDVCQLQWAGGPGGVSLFFPRIKRRLIHFHKLLEMN